MTFSIALANNHYADTFLNILWNISLILIPSITNIVMALVDEHFGEWEEFDDPKQKGGSAFFPVPQERIPLQHKGHRYQLWQTDSYGIPILFAEFTAPNDKQARKVLPDVIASRMNESHKDAEEFIRMYQKQITLMNIDTLKPVKIHRQSVLQHEWKKLKKIF